MKVSIEDDDGCNQLSLASLHLVFPTRVAGTINRNPTPTFHIARPTLDQKDDTPQPLVHGQLRQAPGVAI